MINVQILLQLYADTFPNTVLKALDCVMPIEAIAANDAKKRFDLERMAKEYMGWYEEIISDKGERV